MKTILHSLFFALLTITTGFAQGGGGGGVVTPAVPDGFPERVSSSFEEAWEAAIGNTTTYHRYISTQPYSSSELTVIGGTQNLGVTLNTPVTMDQIENVTMHDDPYFRLADDRTTVHISRSLTGAAGFETFNAYVSFQLEKLDAPVGYATHRIPEWARVVSYSLSYYDPLEVPDTVTDAHFVTYDPNNPYHVETHDLQVFRRGGKTYVMRENWIYSDPNLANTVLVINTATGSGRYDYGNGGQVSTRGSYPLSIAPTRVELNGGKKIRVPFSTGELAPVEETIFRFGGEGQFLENLVYDISMTNAPANSVKTLKFRILGQWSNGGVAPTALRIVTRDNAGVVVENVTEPLNINPDLWFRVILRSGASSCRVWAIWPDGITTTNGWRYGKPVPTTPGQGG